MGAVLLDPKTGRPEQPSELLAPSGLPLSLQGNIDRGWRVSTPEGVLDRNELDRALGRAPDSALEMLERRRYQDAKRGSMLERIGLEPRAGGSMQSWQELVNVIVTDGTQVSATTTETIMVPDWVLAAGYLYQGRALRYTILGNVSTVITTPGTIIFALRYGGVAGTVLATSGAFASDPTAASTTVTVMVTWYLICRAVGTAAATFAIGNIEWNDYDDASAATIVGNLNMRMAPVSVPAAVNINTTTANALSPTVKFSVSTAGTQFTANMALLEALS